MDGPSEVDPAINCVEPATAVPTAVSLALGFTADTSDKYVPAPSAKAILEDHIAFLQDIRPRVGRGPEQVKLRQRAKEDELRENEQANSGSQATNHNLNQPANRRRCDDGNDQYAWNEVDAEEDLRPKRGFKTGLYEKLKSRADKPSEQEIVETFLNDLEKVLGNQIQRNILKEDKRKISEFDRDLCQAVKALGHEKDWALVPSDKRISMVASSSGGIYQVDERAP